MQEKNGRAMKASFLSILKACINVDQGRQIHKDIIEHGFQADTVVSGALIDMYARCKSMEEASRVFERMPRQDLRVLWSRIIAANVQNGEYCLALECFETMQHQGIKPSKFTYLSLLNGCRKMGCKEQGRRIHEQIFEDGCEFDTLIGNNLLDLYAKWNGLEEAKLVFNALTNRDVVSWNTIMSGYNEHGESRVALDCFEGMKSMGLKPSKVTFLAISRSCSAIGSIEKARYIHEQIIMNKLQYDIMIATNLVNMYVKCKSLDEAFKLFENLPYQNAVSWSVMIAGYAQQGEGYLAIECFKKMQEVGLKPLIFTYISVIKACSMIGILEHCRCIHEQILKAGFEHENTVVTTLVDMYAKSGGLKEACKQFDKIPRPNVVSWNAIVAAYILHGESWMALECYEEMQCMGIKPDVVTFSTILKACSSIRMIELSRCMHEHVAANVLQYDIILWNSLIDIYVQSGSLEEACIVFNFLPNRDPTSWNTMISGYSHYGQHLLALECFKSMQHEGVHPDSVTFLSVLKTCSSLGALHHGISIHKQITESGLQSDIIMGSAIVDMYAKCGELKEANSILDELPNQNVISWSGIIAGYAQFGDVQMAVQSFETMQQSGVAPDDVAFVGIFTAFSHVGLVDEGLWYFKRVKAFYGIMENISHVVCMVDLLGHAGLFQEAEHILISHAQPNICMWIALLSACKLHCNIKTGRRCFSAIILIDPYCTRAYILMANLYASTKYRTRSLL